jgi:hypothetical protein
MQGNKIYKREIYHSLLFEQINFDLIAKELFSWSNNPPRRTRLRCGKLKKPAHHSITPVLQ